MRVSYLAEGDLHPSQVVVIPEVSGGVINVIDAQLQVLNSLKVIIHSKALTEGWVRRVLYMLRASQLARQTKPSFFFFLYHLKVLY